MVFQGFCPPRWHQKASKIGPRRPTMVFKRRFFDVENIDRFGHVLGSTWGAFWEPFWLPKPPTSFSSLRPRREKRNVGNQKLVPRGSKRPPRASKRPPRGSKMTPRGPQEEPKRAPGGPKRATRRPKRSLRGLQEAPSAKLGD